MFKYVMFVLAIVVGTTSYAAKGSDYLIINYSENGDGTEHKYKILADAAFMSKLGSRAFTCGVKHNKRSLNLTIEQVQSREGILVKVVQVDERTMDFFLSESHARSPRTISLISRSSNQSSEPYRSDSISIESAELTVIDGGLSSIPNVPFVNEPTGDETAFEFGCWLQNEVTGP